MTVITRRPENRLAKTIFAPGGKTVSQTLKDAEKALDAVRPENMESLKAKLLEIQQQGHSLEKEAKVRDLRAMYALSSDVIDIAGVFGLSDLSDAAYSLCELLDNMGSRKVWNWAAVKVHLDGLLLLSDPANAPPEARKKVVHGLREVCQRVSSR